MRESEQAPTTIFSAIFPLRGVRRDLFPWIDRFENLVDEISGSAFSSPDKLGHPPMSWKISKIAAYAEIAKLLATEPFWGTVPIESVVRIDFRVRTPTLSQLKKDITPNHEMPNEEYLPTWEAFISGQVKDEIAIIMMAMDLCDPDSAFRGAYLLTDQGKWRWKSSGYACFEDAYEVADEQNFPQTEKLDFIQVWEYLKSTPGLRDGVGSTPAAKLAVALTYLYAVQSHSARFFCIVWCCYGLEGFYSQGSDSRGRQAAQKLSLFLQADRDTCEAAFSKLYKARSTFIHGNKALSSALIELQPPDGKISIEEWDAEHIGSYFLLETLRECIRRNISEQKFALKLA